MRLFDIGQQFDALDALLVESGGEVTPEIDAWLEEYGALEAEKIDGYSMYIRSLEHEADGFKAVATEFAAKRKARENAAQRLKDRLKIYMEVQGQPQIKGKLYTATLTKNGGKAPLILDTDDPRAFPADCCVTTVSIDPDVVRAAIEKGMLVPARLGEVGSHVRIR